MWIFSKCGHINIAQQGDSLVVQSRTRDDIDQFVALLAEVAGHGYEVEAVIDGDYRCQVKAARQDVAAAAARLVAEIDYSRLMRSVTFDFGAQPGFVLLMQPNGLQVARLSPE